MDDSSIKEGKPHHSSHRLSLMGIDVMERVRWWLWVRFSRVATAWTYQFCREFAISYIPSRDWAEHRTSSVSPAKLADLMSIVQSAHILGLLRAHGCTSRDHPDFPALLTLAAADSRRFWMTAKMRANRNEVRMEILILEFLFGPAPTLFFMEHRVAAPGYVPRRQSDFIYKRVVRLSIHPHLRYSSFFLDSSEDPIWAREHERAKQSFDGQDTPLVAHRRPPVSSPFRSVASDVFPDRGNGDSAG